MKNALYIIIGLALFLIGYKVLSDKGGKDKDQSEVVKGPRVHTGDEPFRIGDGGLKGSWVKFDGVYRAEMDRTVYYMRYYPEGNVTLIAGFSEEESTVPFKDLMAQDSPPGINNIHNTLVDLRGDSLIFTTKFFKGEIDYRGARVDGDPDKLRFLKHSRINGKKAIIEYEFVPD